MGSVKITPEHFDRRLFPHVIDQRAKETPSRLYAMIPRTQALEDGWQEFSYGQLANAIDKMAWWLDEHIGESEPFSAFGYMGASDLRYVFVVVAAIKTGRTAFIPLFTNCAAALVKLAEMTKCKAIFATSDSINIWEPVESLGRLKTVIMPEMDYWLKDEPVKPYLYQKTYEQAKDDIVMILHTSGTTGLPKLIPYSNYCAGFVERERAATSDTLDTRISWDATKGQKVISTMPASWILGMVVLLLTPLAFDSIPVILPADKPPSMTPEYMDRVIQATSATGIACVPNLLKQISRIPSALGNFNRKFDFVVYGGAPLEKVVGDLFSPHLQLVAVYGTTEGGSNHICVLDRKDWEYYRFHPISGAKFEPFSGDLHELVLVRNQEPLPLHAIFCYLKEEQEYRTKDLFREHPTNKGSWVCCGRVDDFVKLASLTKFNAVHAETIIGQHPSVRTVIMAGDGMDVPFMLVEPELRARKKHTDDRGELDSEALIEEFWPAVEEANRSMVKEVGLRRELVVVTKEDNPIVRTAKEGVNRRETLMRYEDEIARVYERLGELKVAPTYQG